MERPASQHLFALAAELERIQLTLESLIKRLPAGPALGIVTDTTFEFPDLVRSLLEAGNLLSKSLTGGTQ